MRHLIGKRIVEYVAETESEIEGFLLDDGSMLTIGADSDDDDKAVFQLRPPTAITKLAVKNTTPKRERKPKAPEVGQEKK